MSHSGRIEPWWDDVERDPVYQTAVEWLMRLQDSQVTLEDTVAWQLWMKASPRHAQAFARIEDISLAARAVAPPRAPRVRDLARDAYDGSIPLGEWRPEPNAHSHWIRPRLSLAIAACMTLLVLGVLATKIVSSPTAVARKALETAVGENKTVTLEDGSQLTLGGSSRVLVELSQHARAIELAKGEAFFVVAKDPQRPFSVRAGNATVTAVGTQFNVKRDSDRAVIAVTEGRVLVEPVSSIVPLALLREIKPKLRAVRLDAGEQTTAGDAGIEAASRVADPSATTSWQTGHLAFRLQPLKYVLEEVNRYTRKPIVLEDPNIGELIITGTVTSGDVTGWIGSLERGFGLVAVEESDRIVVDRRRP